MTPEMRAHKTHTIGIIVCERDIDSPFRSTGAIIFEQYTNVDAEHVQEKAQQLVDGGKYGRVWYGRINPDELQELFPDGAMPF